MPVRRQVSPYAGPMVRRAVAALVTALLVAACGSGGHSSSKSSSSSSSSSSAAGSTAAANGGSPPASSTAPAQTATSSTATAASSSSTATTATAKRAHHTHTHTQPPESTPHFLVKLKIGSGGSLTPPGVAIGGHTSVEVSVANGSGGPAKLEVAHGSQNLFSRTLPPGETTSKLPALKNATYTLLVDGKPRGTLTIGAKAGP
jgi:hypothetical protein